MEENFAGLGIGAITSANGPRVLYPSNLMRTCLIGLQRPDHSGICEPDLAFVVIPIQEGELAPRLQVYVCIRIFRLKA